MNIAFKEFLDIEWASFFFNYFNLEIFVSK